MRKTKKRMEAIRIVNLVTQMEGGGAQRAAITLTEKLNERGYQCETWFFYKKRPIYEKEPNTFSFMSSRPNDLGELLHLCYMLFMRLRDSSPDAVITYSHYANTIGCFIAWLAGISIRIARHGNPFSTYPLSARVIDWLWGFLGIYTSIVAVSQSVCDSFKNHPSRYRKRLQVIHNMVYDDREGIGRDQARSELNLPANAFILVNVGRLSDQKNQSLLIEMVREINPKLNIKVVIAGEGDLHEALEIKAKNIDVMDRVILLGELYPEQVRLLLSATDAFVFPSKYEGLSNALLEAISFGLPVLASDIPSNREVLGQQGLYLPAENPLIWAEWVEKLYRDEDLRELLRKVSTERAKLFNLDKVIDKYIDLLSNK